MHCTTNELTMSNSRKELIVCPIRVSFLFATSSEYYSVLYKNLVYLAMITYYKETCSASFNKSFIQISIVIRNKQFGSKNRIKTGDLKASKLTCPCYNLFQLHIFFRQHGIRFNLRSNISQFQHFYILIDASCSKIHIISHLRS